MAAAQIIETDMEGGIKYKGRDEQTQDGNRRGDQQLDNDNFFNDQETITVHLNQKNFIP